MREGNSRRTLWRMTNAFPGGVAENHHRVAGTRGPAVRNFLAAQPHRLQPPEHFLDPFAFLLTHLVARVPRRAPQLVRFQLDGVDRPPLARTNPPRPFAGLIFILRLPDPPKLPPKFPPLEPGKSRRQCLRVAKPKRQAQWMPGRSWRSTSPISFHPPNRITRTCSMLPHSVMPRGPVESAPGKLLDRTAIRQESRETRLWLKCLLSGQ
jgi:hypothetical protein